MKRNMFILGWLAFAAVVLGMLTCWIVGIWLDEGRLGGIGAVLMFVAIGGGLAMGWWSDFAPQRNLPRVDRRRLREERERIAVDAEIARMEREAGLS